MQAPAHVRRVSFEAGAAADPYLKPQTSLRNKLARVAWGIVYTLLYRWTPRPMHGWRAFLLRCFGAKLGPNCHMYPGARIWAPWNLVCAENATLADEVVIYNVSKVFMASHAIVSQQAYVCTATHDFDDPTFPMISSPIHIGAYAWVCARACVLPGVTVGEGAVLGLAAVAAKDLDPWQVYAGNPAKRIKARRRHPIAAPA
jgi:putative colanic acid biosynthesis acetyltransferase WcaF